MAQYKVPIRFSRKLKLFFLLISKIIFAAYMVKRTPMFSQLFYLFFFWVSSKIKIEGEIDRLLLKKRMRVRSV